MRGRFFISLLAAGLFSLPAAAQFYSAGNDPGNLKWSYIDSPGFRIIYPAGLDSLARVYAGELEYWKVPVSRSTGLLPGEGYKGGTPVVLHAWTATSNGSVSWAPKVMDLYTVPDPYDPGPLPWESSLVVHEIRHLSQMQAGYKGFFKPLRWIFGEMAPGAVSGIYPSTVLLEGDAVVAETALTSHGRGRRASFLSYYMAAFDEGDMRSWHRWRWGSFKTYAPDHYALGYMTIAGTRYFYGDTLFMQKYFRTVSRHPLRLFNMQKQIKAASGMSFRESFGDISRRWYDLWREEAELRAPYTPSERVSPEADGWFTSWSSPAGNLYALRAGLRESRYLWKIGEDGKTVRIRPFASGTGHIKASGDTLWWSEAVPDKRWSLKMSSRIRYMIPSEGRHIHDLTREGRYYNPAPDAAGNRIAAVRYPVEGGTLLEVLTIEGSLAASYRMPSGLQAVEPVWAGERLCFSGLSGEGFGIYEISGNDIRALLPPAAASMDGLAEREGRIVFASDRSGVSEIYELDPESGEVLQLTSTRYGASEPYFKDGMLYYTSLSREGKHIMRTADPKGSPVDFSKVRPDRIADELSSQEEAIADGGPSPKMSLSEPRKYHKAARLLHIHSWAPVYMSPDVSTSDLDNSLNESAIGATVLFQDNLSLATGSAGYSYRPDIATRKYRHGGHFDITYRGFYPVIQATLRTLDRSTRQYGLTAYRAGDLSIGQVTASLPDKPAFEFSLNASIPLNFSSGGWTRALVPRLSYVYSNDLFSKRVIDYDVAGGFNNEMTALFAGYEPGRNVRLRTLSTSVRAYSILPTPSSGIFPRFGFGGELGFHARLSLSDIYTAGLYGAADCWLPGLRAQQGLKLMAVYQHLAGHDTATGENAIVTRPRGLADSWVNTYLAAYVPDQLRLSADYALPFSLGDIAFLSPLLYVKNFILTPHFDCTFLIGDKGYGGGTLTSAGADLEVKAANLLWLPYDCSFGFRFDYNGGSAYKDIDLGGYELERIYVGGLFSVSF